MHWVGFEPTRLSPYELESYPLDRSGTNAKYSEGRFRSYDLRVMSPARYPLRHPAKIKNIHLIFNNSLHNAYIKLLMYK